MGANFCFSAAAAAATATALAGLGLGLGTVRLADWGPTPPPAIPPVGDFGVEFVRESCVGLVTPLAELKETANAREAELELVTGRGEVMVAGSSAEGLETGL